MKGQNLLLLLLCTCAVPQIIGMERVSAKTGNKTAPEKHLKEKDKIEMEALAARWGKMEEITPEQGEKAMQDLNDMFENMNQELEYRQSMTAYTSEGMPFQTKYTPEQREKDLTAMLKKMSQNPQRAKK
ncbi:MAG: hypothetical protein UU47_C0022G0009 [candidate division TM6 bacterium GW2011_GWE2_41_16]|nr:MAG: hypothetical protein UU47_C0022G0009 [candidate division TM6 bacterium GW2011_GWE2_41_16]